MAIDNKQQIVHVNCAETKTNDHALALLHDHHHMRRKGSSPARSDNGGSPLRERHFRMRSSRVTE